MTPMTLAVMPRASDPVDLWSVKREPERAAFAVRDRSLSIIVSICSWAPRCAVGIKCKTVIEAGFNMSGMRNLGWRLALRSRAPWVFIAFLKYEALRFVAFGQEGATMRLIAVCWRLITSGIGAVVAHHGAYAQPVALKYSVAPGFLGRSVFGQTAPVCERRLIAKEAQ